MTAAVIGLLLPVIAGWLVLRLRRPHNSELVTLTIGGACGLGLSSIVTFWCVVSGVAIDARFAVVDALGWCCVLGAVAWWRRRDDRAGRPTAAAPDTISPRLTAADWLVRAAFAVVVAIALATAVAHNLAAPHGEWDAWAIWNQKARFLVRDVAHWTGMLEVPWSNPSHPLFVSLSVARLWAYAGNETTLVPATLGIVWGIGIVAAVMGALNPRRRRAWIAGSVLVAPATFPQLASAQTADLAEALFVVATLIVLRSVVVDAGADTHDLRRRLLLAGVLAGIAAWTKNEGLVLIAATTPVVAWITLRRGQVRELLSWVAGAAPITATVLWFKSIAPLAPEYPRDTAGVPSLVARALDPALHGMIASLIAPYWVKWGGPLARGALLLTIAVAVWTAVGRSGRSARIVLMTLALMFAADYVVWVLTPMDTAWLIGTTFDRLIMQLWPALVLIVFAPDDRAVKESLATTCN